MPTCLKFGAPSSFSTFSPGSMCMPEIILSYRRAPGVQMIRRMNLRRCQFLGETRWDPYTQVEALPPPLPVIETVFKSLFSASNQPQWLRPQAQALQVPQLPSCSCKSKCIQGNWKFNVTRKSVAFGYVCPCACQVPNTFWDNKL